MDWIRTPIGIAATALVVVALAALVYWLRRQRLAGVDVSLGPVKIKLEGKKKEAAPPAAAPGVNFGADNDFSGATIAGIAGRDVRHGGAASGDAPGGRAPGVSFGRKSKFRDAHIEDVAGRDVVEE